MNAVRYERKRSLLLFMQPKTRNRKVHRRNLKNRFARVIKGRRKIKYQDESLSAIKSGLSDMVPKENS
jgi:hypothetical protein